MAVLKWLMMDWSRPLAQEVVPSMEEVGLLRDALKQLDQPFLMVVVGEFNSGKSTVINALLGRRFLAEGILPTTNEISVLKFRSAYLLTPPTPPNSQHLILQRAYACNSRQHFLQLSCQSL